MAKERKVFEGGKDYVLGVIKNLSENDSMSTLVTDNKQFPLLGKLKKGEEVVFSGTIKRIDKPAGAEYPYFIIKLDKVL